MEKIRRKNCETNTRSFHRTKWIVNVLTFHMFWLREKPKFSRDKKYSTFSLSKCIGNISLHFVTLPHINLEFVKYSKAYENQKNTKFHFVAVAGTYFLALLRPIVFSLKWNSSNLRFDEGTRKTLNIHVEVVVEKHQTDLVTNETLKLFRALDIQTNFLRTTPNTFAY